MTATITTAAWKSEFVEAPADSTFESEVAGVVVAVVGVPVNEKRMER